MKSVHSKVNSISDLSNNQQIKFSPYFCLMLIVEVNQLQVLSPIGVSAEEKLIHRTILANIAVECHRTHPNSDEIDSTIDYSLLANLAKTELLKPYNLLETAAEHIINAIMHSLSNNPSFTVSKVTISLAKQNPLIGSIACKETKITLTGIIK